MQSRLCILGRCLSMNLQIAVEQQHIPRSENENARLE